MAHKDGFLVQDAPDTPDEYTMAASADIVWITVGGLSVHIIHEDNEVRAEIFPLDQEDDEPLASCKAREEDYSMDEERDDELDTTTPLY